ncbi:MAG: phosphoenolpyruvate--protein phosphotransferase [Acidocella sp. 20-63-7]|nr:MAG: phosphoenolpyruvate--protein phosphotransferase [Acidocella sp. 20-63-7]HQT47235.1 phosphoenolpyruvate-utilizing N-terminal domain-containing protein [Acidocella sp.]
MPQETDNAPRKRKTKPKLGGTRQLFARLREVLASGTASLPSIAELVAQELPADASVIYVARPGEVLELAATFGLNVSAVGRTRLRVGEGIIGIVASSGDALNLADAQNHPRYVYRSEIGEEAMASMLAMPIKRAGRILGVIALMSRQARVFTTFEVEALATVAMLLAEILASAGATDLSEEGFSDALPRRYAGHILAGGIARGQILAYGAPPPIARLLTDDPASELVRLEKAVEEANKSLDNLITSNLPGGNAPRDVLEAYRMVAQSSGWLTQVRAAIADGLTAETAVDKVARALRERMRRIADPYLRERLADIEDMIGRLMVALGGMEPKPENAAGMILLVRRLGPADLLDWHARGIAGIAIEEASTSSHAAILARALGLPALAVDRGAVEAGHSGDDALLDAEGATLILRPERDVLQVYERALEARSVRAAVLAAYRDRPAITRDGTVMKLMLNVGLALELDQLERTGADGIGLYRTEIAALAAGGIPDVAGQAAEYGRVMDRAKGRPVQFRTLDLGADKLLPGEAGQGEENPAMGWRSLRVGLDRPAILRRQLRALLLGAQGRPLSIMFPMVATVEEFRAARDLLEAEAARIRPAPESLDAGTMIEVPSLLFQLPGLLAEADFISVGTNDLMQFLFAADRGTPELADRYDTLSAPVLEILERLVIACEEAGVPLSICGEAAGRPLDALAFAAVGVTTLSMSGNAILPVKALLVEADLNVLRPVLRELRRAGAAGGSIREPLAAWAREHNLPI